MEESEWLVSYKAFLSHTVIQYRVVSTWYNFGLIYVAHLKIKDIVSSKTSPKSQQIFIFKYTRCAPAMHCYFEEKIPNLRMSYPRSFIFS